MYQRYFESLELPLLSELPALGELSSLALARCSSNPELEAICEERAAREPAERASTTLDSTANTHSAVVYEHLPPAQLFAWLEFRIKDRNLIRPEGNKFNINSVCEKDEVHALEIIYDQLNDNDVAKELESGAAFCVLLQPYDTMDILTHINKSPRNTTARAINYKKCLLVLHQLSPESDLPRPLDLAEGLGVLPFLQEVYQIVKQHDSSTKRQTQVLPKQQLSARDIEYLDNLYGEFVKSKNPTIELPPDHSSKDMMGPSLTGPLGHEELRLFDFSQIKEVSVDNTLLESAVYMFEAKHVDKPSFQDKTAIQRMNTVMQVMNDEVLPKMNVQIGDNLVIMIKHVYLVCFGNSIDINASREMKMGIFNLKTAKGDEFARKIFNTAVIVVKKLDYMLQFDIMEALNSNFDELLKQNSFYCYQLMYFMIGIWHQLNGQLTDFEKLCGVPPEHAIECVKPRMKGEVYSDYLNKTFGPQKQLLAKDHNVCPATVKRGEGELLRAHPLEEQIEERLYGGGMLSERVSFLQQFRNGCIIARVLDFLVVNRGVSGDTLGETSWQNRKLLGSNASLDAVQREFELLEGNFRSETFERYGRNISALVVTGGSYDCYEFTLELLRFNKLWDLLGDELGLAAARPDDTTGYFVQGDNGIIVRSTDGLLVGGLAYEAIDYDGDTLLQLAGW